MPLDKELLDILRCPKCKGTLSLEEKETGFVCEPCKLRYAVVDGIPNFLISEAQPLER
jgi:uncharacterized protein